MSSEPRRERKVVSVLFADLVGFTSRAETLDPEDVEAILHPFHQRLRVELERRGGTVEKFIGDAVMAVFGAPVSHEDDPERAVRAALAIRDWIREEDELEVRIAVNTGEVLVSLDPSPGGERGLVSGDVVNTASRLQSAAPVNGVLVGETTYNATSRVIEYREAQAVEAKGKSQPVKVWEAIEARSRYGSDIAHEQRSPLVGRDRELELLVGALARVQAERSTQLVTLAGVPGIGKSRLVFELFSAVDAQPELIFWRQGRCLPYGEGVAFWALSEILKAHAGILEGEAEERASQKLQVVVEEAVSEQEVEWIAGQLRPLLGLAETGELSVDRRTESFAAWRRFFEGLAEQSPLVIVFEDLHWADEGLLDFVDHLVDWATGVPILVVATTRPELLARRPGWGGGKPNSATVSLSPLTEQETATLVHGLLERAVLPAEIQTTLLDRAGGNPLYAEEFARIALERGALTDGGADLPLPESVQGLIAARLDALGEDEKRLVQDVSVIGKVFWLGAAAALADEEELARIEQLLHGLERKQFVRRERRSSMEGDTQYAFAHTLVREVAYGQIPRADRAEKHRRAAVWIESFGRSEDYAELRAHHYMSALETMPPGLEQAEDLVRSARLALREAGDRAVSLNAYNAAARDYDRAIELWPEDDPDRPRLLLSAALARVPDALGDPEELAVARDALLEAGDNAGAAEAEIERAEVLWLHGRGEDVVVSVDRAAELAGALPTSEAKASVYVGLFRIHWLAARDELAFKFGDEALRMAEELDLQLVRANVMSARGSARTTRGDRGGFEEIEEAIAIFERLNSSDAQRPYNNLADGLYNLGELREAADATERMLENWKRFSSLDWLRWAHSQEIRLLYLSGRWDDATEIADRWIAEAQAGPGHYLEPFWRWYRGHIRLARGDTAGALDDASTAVEVGRLAADPQVLIPSLAVQSRLLWWLGEDGAEELALELLEAWSHSLLIPSDWLPDLGAVVGGLGRGSDLEAVAATVSAASAHTPWLESGLALGRGDPLRAAEILQGFGARPYEAEARLVAAREGLDADLPSAIAFFREVGATAYLREAETLLAKTRSA
jgi:class 3 adenylate cyclase/tetratricopeptide (TPR) repeat protein